MVFLLLREHRFPCRPPGLETWAAAEGEADYFATHVCGRKIWPEEIEKNRLARETATEVERGKCDAIWDNEAEQNICYRQLAGVKSLILTMAALSGEDKKPQFETPYQQRVEKTNPKYPETQCRMDTSLQGALCLQEFNGHIIPGKDVPGGLDREEAEREALLLSCSATSSYSIGLRPGCWFKHRIEASQ